MSSRTMIGQGVFPSTLEPGVYRDPVSFKDEVGRDPKPAEIIEYQGEQYAKLPEGWPAAEAKDLEEAHAEAVANDEPEPEDRVRNIYATFTPEEVQELCEDWVRLVEEVTALRKGMKTMQRKTRKQNQVQRRLERRLNQARASRDRHLKATDVTIALALEDMRLNRGVVVRGGE